jgi:hypothetical protein
MRTSSACPRGVVSAATGSAIRHVLQIAPATLELSAQGLISRRPDDPRQRVPFAPLLTYSLPGAGGWVARAGWLNSVAHPFGASTSHYGSCGGRAD